MKKTRLWILGRLISINILRKKIKTRKRSKTKQRTEKKRKISFHIRLQHGKGP